MRFCGSWALVGVASSQNLLYVSGCLNRLRSQPTLTRFLNSLLTELIQAQLQRHHILHRHNGRRLPTYNAGGRDQTFIAIGQSLLSGAPAFLLKGTSLGMTVASPIRARLKSIGPTEHANLDVLIMQHCHLVS